MPAPTPPVAVRPSTLRACLAAAARLLNAAARDPDGLEPLVPLWREWRRAAAAVNRSCRAAQRLERQLMASIGPPRVEVPLDPPPSQPVYASDARAIDRLLGTDLVSHPLRDRLKQDLAAMLARWEREAATSGLNAAQAEEAAASQRAEAVLARAVATPARSLVGVLAKLTIAAEWGSRDPDHDAQPWPFLHSALADLVNEVAAARSTDTPAP